MKVVENSPENARNCTIFKNFLGGTYPKTPLATARSFAARDMPLRGMHTQNHFFKSGPPPQRNPAYAPAVLVTLHAHGKIKEFVAYLTKKKHVVFRVIIKVTEKLVII